MSPEQPIQLAKHRSELSVDLRGEVVRLDDLAAQLMAVQRYWNAPSRAAHLASALAESRVVWLGIQDALAESSLDLPLDVQHNLLILSVYAESKIGACEESPSSDLLGSLIALTHTLATSLKEWRAAA